mgnify:CR=1 FL=1
MMESKFHTFAQPIQSIPLPERFTYPFHYTPHPLCVIAAEETQAYLKDEPNGGKSYNRKLIRRIGGSYSRREVGYLAAFSGNLAGKNVHPFFVPPRSMTYYNRMVSSGKRRSRSMRSMPVSEPSKPLQLSKTHGRGYKARSNTAISYYRPQKT